MKPAWPIVCDLDWSLQFKPMSIEHQNYELNLIPGRVEDVGQDSQRCSVLARLGTHDLKIVLDSRLVDALLFAAVPGAVLKYDGSLNDQALLVHMASPVLDTLSQHGLGALQILSAIKGHAQLAGPFASVILKSSDGIIHVPTWLYGDKPVEAAIHGAFTRHSRLALEKHSFKTSARIVAGSTMLTVRDVKNLKPGFGIAIDWCPLADNFLHIQADGIQRKLQVTSRKVTLLADQSFKTSADGGFRRDISEIDSNKPGEDGTIEDFVNPENVKLELTFEVARLEMTLGQLALLAVGTQFDLDRDPQSFVTIMANGQPIGTGDIVQAGHKLVVRVKSLSS